MTRRFWLRAFAAGLAIVLLAGFQLTNDKKDKPRDPKIRNVSGLVQLPDENPAQGAVVKLKNVKNLQVTSYITQANGRYQFQNLSTNIDYEIQAEYKDLRSAKRTLSVFESRLDMIINLQLQPANKEASK